MILEASDRLEFIKLEMQLLQQRLTKYDELIWAVRSWAVTLTVALVGWASTKVEDPVATAWLLRIAAVVPPLFWIEEGILRASYVTRYIDRYRLLRSALNGSSPGLEKLPIYDLTSHHAGRTPRARRLFHSFLRVESIFLYLSLTAVPLLFTLLLHAENASSKEPNHRRSSAIEAHPSGYSANNLRIKD
jgi:hypothetical protein